MAVDPDAEALLQAAIHDPVDETVRLVFADWLEETNTPANITWANYIRLSTVAHHGPMPAHERTERRAAVGRNVVAGHTLSLAKFVAHSRGLLHLLPAANVTVKLTDHLIPLSVLAQVPYHVALELQLLPIDWSGYRAAQTSNRNWTERTLVVASADPKQLARDVETRSINLGPGVVHCVRSRGEELTTAIEENYTRFNEAETVTNLLLGGLGDRPRELDVQDYERPLAERLAEGLLSQALFNNRSLIRMQAAANGAIVSMRGRLGWHLWNVIPWWLQIELVSDFRRLADLETQSTSLVTEFGLVPFVWDQRRYEFPIEITSTAVGPDVLIRITEPVDP